MWVCALLEAKRHLAGRGVRRGGAHPQAQLRAAETPGGYPGECMGQPSACPNHSQASLWPPASVQALTITPAGEKAVVVLGAVISWRHTTALQLPQCMDVKPQSLLLNWLSLLGPVLQDGHMHVCVHVCMESVHG